MEDTITVTNDNHSEKILKSLHELQQQQLYCDVCIEGKDGCVCMHHIILQANTTNHQNLSTCSSGQKKLNCKNYSTSVIEAIISFLYTGKIFIAKKRSDEFIKICDELHLLSACGLLKSALTERRTDFEINDEKCCNNRKESLLKISPRTKREFSNVQDKSLNILNNKDEVGEQFDNTTGRLKIISDGGNLYLKSCKETQDLQEIKELTVSYDKNDIFRLEKEDFVEKGDNSKYINNKEVDKTEMGNKSLCTNIKDLDTKEMGVNSSIKNNRLDLNTVSSGIWSELDEENKESVSKVKHNHNARKYRSEIYLNYTEDQFYVKRNGKNELVMLGESDRKEIPVKRKRKRLHYSDNESMDDSVCNMQISSTQIENLQKKEINYKKQKELQNFKMKKNNRKFARCKKSKIPNSCFENQNDLIKKQQKSSTSKKQIPVWNQCGKCHIRFKSYSEHAAHMKEVHRPYPCQMCDWVGHKRHLYASHMYGQHKIVAYPELYPLAECDTKGCKFKCLGINMHEHKRCHLYKTDQLVCDGCGMKFTSIGGLRRHSLKHQDEELKYKCKECGKVFGWHNQLTNHTFSEHAVEKLCHLCPFKTKSKITLNIHLHNKHGEPIPDNQTVHTCDICDFYCFSSSHLRDHKEQKHSEKAMYKCISCPKSFKSRKSLRMHRIGTHEDKNVKCPLCDYKTYSKSTLKHHLNSSHSDLRPYACPHCEYSCKLKCNLGKHVKNVHKNDHSIPSISQQTEMFELTRREFPEKRKTVNDHQHAFCLPVESECQGMLSQAVNNETMCFNKNDSVRDRNTQNSMIMYDSFLN